MGLNNHTSNGHKEYSDSKQRFTEPTKFGDIESGIAYSLSGRKLPLKPPGQQCSLTVPTYMSGVFHMVTKQA